MKKKITAFVLAALLVCAMAVPASAAYSYGGTFYGATGSCSYEVYAVCSNTGWNAFTRWISSTDGYQNYVLRTDVTPRVYNGNKQTTLDTQPGAENLRMATNINPQAYAMHSIRCDYYINQIKVVGPVTVYPE